MSSPPASRVAGESRRSRERRSITSPGRSRRALPGETVGKPRVDVAGVRSPVWASFPLDPLDDRAHSSRLGGALVDASEGAELLEGAGERLEQRLAVLTACEVAADSSAGA